ncbi:TetR family transcriptional regulator [Thalassotalea insulae]|uniref:TetR family transcriptional regulator n=1 Tax=Thalassotalea insulae TaxID=2056778 RepID=A0ABQ6GX15_9GAMM|nr:TetR/AcrR family transcriptional regulator [Thalassotalea insulae]GLX79186.1 TetR family transcriptional regulator [Thalassotalea insulae]
MVSDRKICQLTLSERGKKILAVAQNLFLEHGFDHTSLEMIISESGGSRRSIYDEFGNKQGLLMAVMKLKINSQLDVLASIDYQKPMDKALKDICSRFVQGFVSPTMLSLFRLVAQLVVKIPEIGELIYQEGPLRGVTPLADYLQHLSEQGQLAIDEPHFAAQMLIEMCKGRLHIQAILLPNHRISQQEIEQHVDKAVNVFLKAYSR